LFEKTHLYLCERYFTIKEYSVNIEEAAI